MKRVLSGIQPTGIIHIGNYLGAIKNWIPFQHDYETLFCIVDLHALTANFPRPQEMADHIRLMAACYIACGIDPTKSVIFKQSHVSGHSELSWLLGCMTPLGWLNRMTQFKDKAGSAREAASLGLYAYPVLMAADILLYQATHVPVGADQKQHLELARDIAHSFNRHVGESFFNVPEPCLLGAATRVMSLRDGTQKMSKSDPSDFSRINLMDSADEIAQKIRKAKTDSLPIPETLEELEGRNEARNLLNILSSLTGEPATVLLNEFSGQTFSGFKARLIEVLHAEILPIGERIRQILAEPSRLDLLLQSGAERASLIAKKTMKEVHTLLGL